MSAREQGINKNKFQNARKGVIMIGDGKRKGRRKGNLKKGSIALIFLALILLLVILTAGFFIWKMQNSRKLTAEDILNQYVSSLNSGSYDEMYSLLDEESQKNISREDFIERNQKIYEGIGASGIAVEVGSRTEEKRTGGVTTQSLTYQMSMNTLAGDISFSQTAVLNKIKGEDYRLSWDHSLIFPDLEAQDKVRITTSEPKRGSIYDRNGILLAGPGVVSSVGLVPGKMSEEPSEDLELLAKLLDTTVESIQKKLSASWVKDDSFVPVREIEKSDVPAAAQPDNLKDQLLAIPGVMITDAEERVYPLKEAAAHVVGYLQNITAEELEKHRDEGYSANSVIGKSGAELLYEQELKGTPGCKIYIVTSDGETKEVLAEKPVQDGTDVTLTLDAKLQKLLYEQYQTDKSASVAMNPKTGEVLALLSTPSYDNNLFVLGMSERVWNSLNDNSDQPLLNRFRATFVPGSSFKPVTAGIGLTAGKLNPDEDFGNVGTSWQKDAGWGNYYVTTLHTYEPVILKNALIYSDNIYFAKAALAIGADVFTEKLKALGFGEHIPFAIDMSVSSYGNSDKIEDEIQLADSGYGQGQLLVNPLHLATLYSAFVNDGNVISPVLRLSKDQQSSCWIENAFSKEAADTVREDLIQVIEDKNGTGHGCKIDGLSLAGKTGTAEIKQSKEDQNGTELGWFVVFTPDAQGEDAFLLVTMVEDVKERGGSGYVVERTRKVVESK